MDFSSSFDLAHTNRNFVFLFFFPSFAPLSPCHKSNGALKLEHSLIGSDSCFFPFWFLISLRLVFAVSFLFFAGERGGKALIFFLLQEKLPLYQLHEQHKKKTTPFWRNRRSGFWLVRFLFHCLVHSA